MKFNILPLLILIPLLVCSQEPARETPPVIEVDFSVFPLEPGKWKGIYYAPQGDPAEESVELFFNVHERSGIYSYQGPSPLVFFRKETGVKGETLFKAVARLPLGETSPPDDLILFFNPADENGRYEIQVMPDNKKTFPPDSLVFYNTLQVTFLAAVGEQALELPPGVSKPVDVRGYDQEPAPVVVAIKNKEDLHLVIQNKIHFAKDRRTLFVIRKPARKNSLRVRVQRLTELNTPPEKVRAEKSRETKEKEAAETP